MGPTGLTSLGRAFLFLCRRRRQRSRRRGRCVGHGDRVDRPAGVQQTTEDGARSTGDQPASLLLLSMSNQAIISQRVLQL